MAGPDHLRVDFADGIISLDLDDLDSLLVPYRRATNWEGAREIIVSAGVMLTVVQLRALSHPLLSDSDFGAHFMRLWLGIETRYLSIPDDENIVFATMLGLHPGKLYLLDSDQLMRGLLDMLEHWSLMLLFADGARLRSPGYQWAPSSFLNTHPGHRGDLIENAKLGRRTEEGLVFERAGYILVETGAECMSQMFMCKEEDSGEWYILEYKVDANPSDIRPWTELSPQKNARNGLLIGNRRSVDGSQWALLVTIKKTKDGIIYATFGC